MFQRLSKQEIAGLYTLELLSSENLVEIAQLWIAEDSPPSPTCQLAGETSPTMSECSSLFEEALDIYEVPLPDFHGAIDLCLKVYLRDMLESHTSPFESMVLIDNNIVKRLLRDESGEKHFVGEELGLEKLFTWYRELQDLNDGDGSYCYSDLPAEQAIEKMEEHLLKEANICFQKLKT